MICTLCNAGLANSEEGKHNHYKKYHAVLLKREYIKMDPQEKTRVVRAWESRNARYLIGHGN